MLCGLTLAPRAAPAELANHPAPTGPSAVAPAAATDYTGRFQYRWGDSPRGPDGHLLWASPTEDSGWQELSGLGPPPGRDGQRWLWLRTTLSGPQLQDPTLQIEIIDQLCEVFVDGRLIYRFGELDGSGPGGRRFLGYPVHYLSLDPALLGGDYRGRRLTLRVYSDHINIGLFGQLRLGTRHVLSADLFRRDLSLLIVGILLSAVGLFCLALFLYQRRERTYLSYGGFAFFVGLYSLCRIKTTFWAAEHPLLSFHLELLTFYSCITCMLHFLAQVIGSGPLRLMPALAWSTTAYAVSALLLAATGVVPILKTLVPFQLLMLLAVLYTLLAVLLALIRGNLDARLFGLGFILAALFSSYDVLTALGVLPRLRTSFSHFGIGAFVLSLGLILLRRFARVYADLLAAKRDLSQQLSELQARHAEIEGLNRELRHQIEARSKSLLDSLLDGSSSSQEAVPILTVDSQLNNRYRIVKALGQGAMGVVYEVERLSDGRHLAAKVLAGRTRRQELARFAREAQLLARLNHPNLVSIVDVDVLDNRMAYLVMELVEGGTLAQRHSRFGDAAFALTVIRQIASALAEVHAAGIVHRDLKPANILLAAGDALVVKLADFGVSALLPSGEPEAPSGRSANQADLDLSLYNVTLDDKAPADRAPTAAATSEAALRAGLAPLQETLDASRASQGHGLTQTGVLIGTPLYMAPELLKGAKLARPASDMFSLGVVAYELLTGELPSDQPPILLNLQPGQRFYTALSLRCPELPGAIAEAIERCLDAAPDRRPTAAALRDLLTPPGGASG